MSEEDQRSAIDEEVEGSASGSALEEGEDHVEDGAAEDEAGEEVAAEEGAAEEGAAVEVEGGSTGDINTTSFLELHVLPEQQHDALDVWKTFISSATSREAAGETIYAALFDAAPSLQSLFVTPRAVQAMKFMNGLASFVGSLEDPPKLKVDVETLGFGHLHLDVTIPRIVIFRDAILDLFAVELGSRFTPSARKGWFRLLNYVGGAIVYCKANFAGRIATLLESWKIVNDKENNKNMFAGEGDKKGGGAATTGAATGGGETKKKKGFMDKLKSAGGLGGGQQTTTTEGEGGGQTETRGDEKTGAQNVPTTYREMFEFNSAVMGFGNNTWLLEILDCFHNIVTNVSNSKRLQEECDILSLRISRVAKGAVNLAEYKSCMLASLRSLLPKDWSTAHEVAWSWLWENVENLLKLNMGNPPKYEKALDKVVSSLDDATKYQFRADIYSRFFALAPAGQDFFKQSNTYLHVIADKIIDMTVDIYKTPVKMVDDISALGLRHVGYAIPTEFFGPFVSACVDVLMKTGCEELAIESFRWSLGLVAKMLVRTITEGSTIVMKAINSNSIKSLRKAIGCAPRGERAEWLLKVEVGTQSISPLFWSIKSGALRSASAIIKDLLTFRADRDKYYYHVDDLFARHPDVVKLICDEAAELLPVLLDGLIWRSRLTEGSQRRVNYYVKHLLESETGGFSKALEWIAYAKDPKIVCHPVVVYVSDLVWSRVASGTFLNKKAWFLTTLIVFTVGQSILQHINVDPHAQKTEANRVGIFACRSFIYLFSMTGFLYRHARLMFKSFRSKDFHKCFGCIPVPKYLFHWQDAAQLLLALSLASMLCLEPVIRCADGNYANGHDTGAAAAGGHGASPAPAAAAGHRRLSFTKRSSLFDAECDEAKDFHFPYSICSMFAMFIYCILVIDLAVFSTRVSAYMLVCQRMLSEVGLFMLALFAIITMGSSAISMLDHLPHDFDGIHQGFLSLFKIFMRMYVVEKFKYLHAQPVVIICIFLFIIATVVFLLNLLIAQLTCAYSAVYVDMVGYARLERVDIIVETMLQVSKKKWKRFMDSLRLDRNLEFNEGDIGVAGGLQMMEPARLNPTTKDQIARFGGSTSPSIQWPAEDEEGDDNDRFDRIEALLGRMLKALSTHGKGGKKNAGGGTGTSGSGSMNEGGGSGDDGEDGED